MGAAEGLAAASVTPCQLVVCSWSVSAGSATIDASTRHITHYIRGPTVCCLQVVLQLEMYRRLLSTYLAIALLLLQSVRGQDGCADVVGATATQSTSDGTWSFSVTVSSDETGWDKYADAWEVRGSSDGTIFGTRTLLHPHVQEQPFTRSLSGVVIPDDVIEVVIAAHDSVLGYCGEEFNLLLPMGGSLESTSAPQAAPPATTLVPTPSPPSCDQEVCALEFSINVEGTDRAGIISDHTIRLSDVTLIHSIEIDIASIYCEDLLIILTSPLLEEYVPMDDTEAIYGPEKLADFDMGKVAGDGSLSNVAKYVFVSSGGLEGFTAPYSPPNIYNADAWGSGNHNSGDWTFQIYDNAAGDEFSIGNVTLRYCPAKSCDATVFPTASGGTTPPPTDGPLPTQAAVTISPSLSSEPESTTQQPQTTTAEPITTLSPTLQPVLEPTPVSGTTTMQPTPFPSAVPSELDMSGTNGASGSAGTTADATSGGFGMRHYVCCLVWILSFSYIML